MKRLLIFLVCPLFMLVSCNDGGIDAAFASAEINMNENPEVSLEILDSVNASGLSTRRQKARYALLYSMALDKRYIDVADDSIIAPAVKYYEFRGSADDRIKTLYYYARVQYNAGDYNPAIVTLMKTLPLFEESSETRMFALIHNLLAVIYNDSGMFTESLKHLNLAYDFAVLCGDVRLEDLILRRKGKYYANIKNYEEAINLFEQILHNDRIGDGKADVLCDYALTLILKDEFEPAVRLYDEALAIKPAFNDVNHLGAYAYALSKTGDNTRSEQIFTQLYALNDGEYAGMIYDSWKELLYSDSGDYKNAYLLLKDMLPYQDSIFRLQFENSAAKAQSDYLLLKNAEIQKQKQHRGLLMSLLVALMVIICMLSYYIYSIRLIRLRKEKEILYDTAEMVRVQLMKLDEERHQSEQDLKKLIDSRSEEIFTLRTCIEERDATLHSLRCEHARMYKTQFRTLGELCEIFIRSNEYKDSHKMVYEKVRNMIKEISGDKSGYSRFEKMIDKSLDNIMTHFREDFPQYSENDYRFISYVIVGFDPTALCVILNMPSLDSVYMKKSRIKKRIRESDSKYKDFYLEMFS